MQKTVRAPELLADALAAKVGQGDETCENEEVSNKTKTLLIGFGF